MQQAILLERYGTGVVELYDMPKESIVWRGAMKYWAIIFKKLEMRMGLMSSDESGGETE